MVAFSHCNVSFREGNSSVDLFFDSTYMRFFEIDCTRVKRTGTLFLSFLSFPAFDACSKNQHHPHTCILQNGVLGDVSPCSFFGVTLVCHQIDFDLGLNL